MKGIIQICKDFTFPGCKHLVHIFLGYVQKLGKFLFPCQAAYLLRREEGERLEDFLSNRVFAGVSGSTAAPDGAEAAAFGEYIQRYKALLQVERAAAELL